MWLKYLEHGRRITPHAPDVRRATSLFVQPAAQSDAAARMEAYRKSDADFYSDASLCFNVTLADMRRYYDDMIADMRAAWRRAVSCMNFWSNRQSAVNKPPAPHSPGPVFSYAGVVSGKRRCMKC